MQVLQRLKRTKVKPEVPLHVCYNPYFPAGDQLRLMSFIRSSGPYPSSAESDAREERQRLDKKLASGCVAGIWLQMGSDLEKLADGVSFLRSCMDKHGCSQLPVYGSVFLPTKQCASRLCCCYAHLLTYRWHLMLALLQAPCSTTVQAVVWSVPE